MKLTLENKAEIKTRLVELIINKLDKELATTITSAENAHLAAVDDQSVAETQYDTLAIEAAYLAEGHSKRIAELKVTINNYQKLLAAATEISTSVKANTIVEIVNQHDDKQLFYVGIGAAGLKLDLGNETITVITLDSPIGKALAGKELDDEFSFSVGATMQSGEIVQLY